MGFAFDSRWTLYKSRNIKITGLQVNFTAHKKHTFGIGLYFLGADSRLDIRHEIEEGVKHEIKATMTYFAQYYKYTYFRRYWLELGGAIYIGSGNVNTFFLDPDTQRNINLAKDNIYVVEFNHPFKIHLTHWLHLHSGIGFRMVLDQERHIAKAFNNFVYQFGVSVNPLEVYRCMFRKQPWIGFKQKSDADYRQKRSRKKDR